VYRKKKGTGLLALSALAFGFVGSSIGAAQTASNSLGIFENQSDVGSVAPPGTATFDAATGVYTVRSAGEDLWANVDGFHFVWKRVSGDVSLTGDVKVADGSATSHPHRKALLMFRQTLDSDALFAVAVIHGSEETALQFRRAKGEMMQTILFNIGAPQRMRLEKRGDTVTLFLSMHGEPLHQTGASMKIHFDVTFYAGLGMCARKKDTVEQATFTHVDLQSLNPPAAPAAMELYSTLHTIAVDPNVPMDFVIQTGKGQMEAPNWSRDGETLIFNRAGKLWSVPASEGEGGFSEARPIDIGNATDCTGSHGLSPDGKWLAMTCATPNQPGRRVYIVPAMGGTPRLVTANPNSYFHSWSPDGRTILFTRPRQGTLSIYSIAADGGQETALTSGTGISDDPDYSSDGRWIYFNSDRAGRMQIWRMRPDGSQPEQVTFDKRPNWTPHPAPDGKSILILSYDKDVMGHPANTDVTLRILNISGGEIRDLVRIVGGVCSNNVPNWAPDGAHVAFVSYQFLPAEDEGSTQ
jgi:TolB protein